MSAAELVHRKDFVGSSFPNSSLLLLLTSTTQILLPGCAFLLNSVALSFSAHKVCTTGNGSKLSGSDQSCSVDAMPLESGQFATSFLAADSFIASLLQCLGDEQCFACLD